MKNFITQAKGLSRNPLGIIALFISLIYGFACLVLSTSISNLNTNIERLPLIWFIIGFPIIILIVFLILVTKHHQKLYSPSDYGNPESFLRTVTNGQKFEPVQIEITGDDKKTKVSNELVRKFEDVNLNKGHFSPETKENLKLYNESIDFITGLFNKKWYNQKFLEISHGVEAPEYFIFSLKLDPKNRKTQNSYSSFRMIIRVTKDNNGILKIIGIGKDIIEEKPKIFAEKVLSILDEFADKNISNNNA